MPDGDPRHYRGVDDPQAGDTVHGESVVDNGEGIVPHPARADGLEDRRAEVPRRVGQRVVALDAGTRLPLLRLEAGQGPRGHDAPGEAQAGHRHPEIRFGGQYS